MAVVVDRRRRPRLGTRLADLPRSDQLTTIRLTRSGTRVTVRDEIADLVEILLESIERDGYRFTPVQCGAYNCRAIRGTSTPSNHSWGLAIDLDWLKNPDGFPMRTTFPAWLVARMSAYGFYWGGDYSSRPDTMHFEWLADKAEAARQTTRARADLGGATPEPTIPSIPEDDMP